MYSQDCAEAKFPSEETNNIFWPRLILSKNEEGKRIDWNTVPNLTMPCNIWRFFDDVVPAVILQKHLKGDNNILYSFTRSGDTEENLEDIIIKIGSYYLVAREDNSFLYLEHNTNSFIYVVYGSKNKSGKRHLSFSFKTTSKSIYEKFEEILSNSLEDSLTESSSINVLIASNYGYLIKSIDQSLSALERSNYIPKVIENFDYINKQFSSNEPDGKLAILSGTPGTGKTYFIKGLINAMKSCTVVIIPVALLPSLDGPTLLPVLIEHREQYRNSHTIFVVEDADSCLVPRMNDNVSVVSSLLNFTDGILGTALDIRILVTTNASKIEFDDALMRPGRLLKHVEIDVLPVSIANGIFKRITQKETNVFNSEVTLAQVYAEAKNVKVDKRKEKTLGF